MTTGHYPTLVLQHSQGIWALEWAMAVQVWRCHDHPRPWFIPCLPGFWPGGGGMDSGYLCLPTCCLLHLSLISWEFSLSFIVLRNSSFACSLVEEASWSVLLNVWLKFPHELTWNWRETRSMGGAVVECFQSVFSYKMAILILFPGGRRDHPFFPFKSHWWKSALNQKMLKRTSLTRVVKESNNP